MPKSRHLLPVVGRDPAERGRAASPLELLYDLTFAVAFSTAGSNVAHLASVGHLWPALPGFGIVMFGTTWAWINFTWMASAFDNDDWLFRLLTMVQMLGVLIFASGIPDAFHSLEQGDHLDTKVIIAGYVVMRIGLVGHWLRVAHHDPRYRRTAVGYAIGLSVIQAGWVVMILTHMSLGAQLTVTVVLMVAEVSLPFFLEFRGRDTPWHPHHIAERYGLLAIITLGECIIGTGTSLAASSEHEGWTAETISMGLSALTLTFGLWWVTFLVPWGEVLERRPWAGKVFGFGYMPGFAALAAVGAALHLAAYDIEGHSEIGRLGTDLALVIPVAVYLAMVYGLYTVCLAADRFHLLLGALTFGVLAVAVVAGRAGASVPTCLWLVALAPIVTIVGYEFRGRHHIDQVLERLDAESAAVGRD